MKEAHSYQELIGTAIGFSFLAGLVIVVIYTALRDLRRVPRVKQWFQLMVTHRKQLAGVIGLIVVLLATGYAWRVFGDENAPHCPSEAVTANRCQAGDLIAVSAEGAVRFCDFNKKLYTFDRGVICRYVGQRASR